MRKALTLLVSVCLIFIIAGCEQQTPEIKTIQSSPKNLVVKGIIYSLYYASDGYGYERQKGQPVSGATVTLTGSFETMTDVTDASGEYVFQNIPYGSYSTMVTKEGYQNTFFNIYEFQGFGVPVEGEIRTFDREISDHPVIRSITPAPDSTIETSAVFTVVFNEPIDTTTVRPKIVSAGLRTFAAGDTPNVTAAWSSNDTVLTITPNTTLLPNMNYQLYLADKFEHIKDKAGNVLAVGDINSGDKVPVYEPGAYINPAGGWTPIHYITYRTASGGVPGAPSGLTLSVGSPLKAPSDMDYFEADEGSEGVSLNWLSASGEVTGYKVYAAKSSAGPYVFIKAYSGNNTSGLTVDDINLAIYGGKIGGSTPTIDPVCNGKGAFINDKIFFKVVAFNGEGESAAVTAEAQDSTGPRLLGIAQSGRTGGLGFPGTLLNNGYYLAELIAGTDTKIAYIAFNEPIDPSTIIAANFTHKDFLNNPKGPIASATLLTSSSSDLLTGEYSIVKITTSTDISIADRITAGTGVKDLAGNPIVEVLGPGDTAIVP